MKIGFYIDSLVADPLNTQLFQKLNEAVERADVEDATVFYNKVNFNPIQPKFGMFNATDIWHFTGLLVATTITNLLTAKNMLNKFQLCYLFDGNKDFVGLLKLPTDVPILVTNENDGAYIHRVTGRVPVRVSGDLEVSSIIQALS